MNELIKVTINEKQEQLVSARELHEYLGVGTHFKDWFPRMCEYGFIEGQDFCSNLSESTGGRPSVEYQVTIEMAKQICMLQRNEKGQEARKYFIELEKAWNNPEMVFARSLQFANQKMIEYKNKLELMQPMVAAYEDLLSTKNNHTMNEVAKIVGVGRNRLFDKLRENKILMKSNLPYESYIEREYFTVREVVIHHSDYDDVKRQTLVTTKGVDWINKKLKEW